jgi:hypothetical protein
VSSSGEFQVSVITRPSGCCRPARRQACQRPLDGCPHRVGATGQRHRRQHRRRLLRCRRQGARQEAEGGGPGHVPGQGPTHPPQTRRADPRCRRRPHTPSPSRPGCAHVSTLWPLLRGRCAAHGATSADGRHVSSFERRTGIGDALSNIGGRCRGAPAAVVRLSLHRCNWRRDHGTRPLRRRCWATRRMSTAG